MLSHYHWQHQVMKQYILIEIFGNTCYWNSKDYVKKNLPNTIERDPNLTSHGSLKLKIANKFSRRDQRLLIEDIRTDILHMTDFVFQDTHAEVISGKQEGVYTWIAINYVLGKFNHQASGKYRSRWNLTLYMLNWFEETWKYIGIFCHFLKVGWCLKSFFMEDIDLFILYSQYHGCWWPGDRWSQVICNHDIDLVSRICWPQH